MYEHDTLPLKRLHFCNHESRYNNKIQNLKITQPKFLVNLLDGAILAAFYGPGLIQKYGYLYWHGIIFFPLIISFYF